MKIRFLITILFFSLLSCQEDIRFNNPSFQGLKNDSFWRATKSKAIIDASGALIVEGSLGFEKITLKTESAKLQNYDLESETLNSATYVLLDKKDNVVFSTSDNLGDGEIVITEYDDVNNTVSGTFKFNAGNTNVDLKEVSVLNFKQGVFYKVPLSSQH